MATSFKVDEDLSEDVVAELRSAGFDAISVVEQRWQGRKDPRLWPDIQLEQRALVTGDKGFGQRAIITPNFGVVLLRPEKESRIAFVRLIRMAIDAKVLHDLVDTVVVVTDAQIRIRKTSD